ncbi:endocuticle structural glycoprotein SgAbd-2-like [Microplitis demolitor]|uniref:endocuticle structural glycoprotein SgAbd-2-like n=1 Tax=Microplitis demolitor TaxID=69319 RepID=UPI00235B6002|nr:endocuticle structural glycoprotein SgAbd-2-like [Microplitis demolitor]
MRFFILLVIVGAAVAQNQYQNQGRQQQQQQYQDDDQQRSQINDRQYSSTTFIPILQWNKEQEHDGTYRTSYETGNNIIAEESGYIRSTGEGEDKVDTLVQSGSYSYTSPEGQLISVTYTADETGFHAIGDHIPTPPPVSEEIQKGLDLIYAGIKKQQEEAAHDQQPPKETQLLSQQRLDRQEDNKKYRF